MEGVELFGGGGVVFHLLVGIEGDLWWFFEGLGLDGDPVDKVVDVVGVPFGEGDLFNGEEELKHSVFHLIFNSSYSEGI